jgi:hypothetical protein
MIILKYILTQNGTEQSTKRTDVGFLWIYYYTLGFRKRGITEYLFALKKIYAPWGYYT